MTRPLTLGILPCLLLSLLCCQQVHAQGFNFWTDPAGGFWNDPTAWSDGFVPGPADPAYLILGDEYTIFSQGTSVDALYVDDGRVDLRSAPSAAMELGYLCQISGNASSGNAARLRLLGPGNAEIGELILGAGILGSELAISDGRTAKIDTIVTTDFSTIRFELSRNAAQEGAAIDVLDRAFVNGTFVLSGFAGEFPAAGNAVLLFDGRGAERGIFSLPTFGRIDTPPGLDVELDFNLFPSGDFRLLVAKVVESATVASVEIDQDFAVGTNPTDLLVVDLDDDGDDDLVVIRPSGKHFIYLRDTNGEFLAVSEIDSAPGTIAGAAGDFDSDGTIDVALISSTVSLGPEVRIFRNIDGDGVFIPGPFVELDETPVSISTVRIPDAVALVASTGVAVTTKSSGRGKTRSYRTTGSDMTKVGEVEVGEEPGRSDPIDDENKKDAGSAVGVAAQTDALAPQPVLRILRTIPAEAGGLEIFETIPLSGNAIDFDSADIDSDGIPETLVLTEAGRLDLVQYGTSAVVHSLPIEGDARAIAIADLDSEGGRDVVIAFGEGESDGRLRVYELTLHPTPGAGDADLRVTLDLRSDVPANGIDPGTLGLVPGADSRIVITGAVSGGSSRLESRRYEEIAIGGCASTDLNMDGRIDAADLGIIIGAWGPCPTKCPADLDGDGAVGSGDLGILFADWGPC